jgi:hypothetical protein
MRLVFFIREPKGNPSAFTKPNDPQLEKEEAMRYVCYHLAVIVSFIMQCVKKKYH